MKATLIKFLLGAEEKTIQTVFSQLRANSLGWVNNPTFGAYVVVEAESREVAVLPLELKRQLAKMDNVHLQETSIAA